MNVQTSVLDKATYRTSPTAEKAIAEWQVRNADSLFVHDQPWDVTDPNLYYNHTWGPIFREMRDQAPVNKFTNVPYGTFWNVTTLKAIQHVEALPKVFSSEWSNGGMVIHDPDMSDPLSAARGSNFLAMDPPDHTPRRRTVAPAFTPAEMIRLSEVVRQRTREVLDSLPVGEEFDWVQKVSIELTTGMLATIFDFPWAHRQVLPFWSDWMSDIQVGLSKELNDMRMEVMVEMGTCMMSLWEERQNAPEAPDLLSRMIHSDAMSGMEPGEFISNMALLIVGGNDTTRNTMSGIVEALDRFPEERAKLEADPSLIPNAVQECIRYITPVAHMRRTAMEDYELEGQLIRKGEKVVLWYVSGNRDDSIFDEPDRLVVDRPNARRHVSFGYGVHRCVGARLAEMQLRILIEELIARNMRPRVTGQAERLKQIFIHGFRKVEVTIDKA